LSAVGQDWPNKEILIVDDGSDQETMMQLQMLHREFTDIRLVHHGLNKGYPAALNTVLNYARGEFVSIFDDDDVSDAGRLRSQLSRIKDYEKRHKSKLIMCYSNRQIVKPNEYIPSATARAIGRQSPEPYGRVVADYLLGDTSHRGFVWGMFGSCTLMARRETFLAIGPFDESFRRCAEWDMAIRAALRGAHFIAVDEALVTQYKTPGADKSEAISLRYALQLREKYKTYLVDRGFYLASFALARSNFYGGKGRLWKSRAYAFLACLLSPVILKKRLVDKIGPFRRWNGLEA
jgi:glycosyltransferase involved in cell wall biosynthesis